MNVRPSFGFSVGLQVILLVVLLVGIYIRFENLDRKIYWHDEVLTSMYVAGYVPPEVRENLCQDTLINAEDLQVYQRRRSNSSIRDTVRILAEFNSQHPPLYYAIVRVWTNFFGDGIASIRGISVWLSLIALPCAYWLGRELFDSALAGGMMTVFVAVSPFQVLMAREARQYGLWVALILFISAALLRAKRQPSWLNWALYAIGLITGMYTFLLTVFVMLSHGLYIAILQGFRLNMISRRYLIATIASLTFFAPWGMQLLQARTTFDSLSWTSQSIPLITLVGGWVANASRNFFDIGLDSTDSLLLILPQLLLVIVLISVSTRFLLWHAPRPVWLFILLLAGVTAIALVMPDIVLGGQRSNVSRYLIPVWISIHLTVTYWLSSRLTTGQARDSQIRRIVLIGLLVACLISDIVIVQSETWWTKKRSDRHPAVAEIINQSTRPLLVSHNARTDAIELISLSYKLDPDLPIFLSCDPAIAQIPGQFDEIFWFDTTPNRPTRFEVMGYVMESVQPGGMVWRANPITRS